MAPIVKSPPADADAIAAADQAPVVEHRLEQPLAIQARKGAAQADELFRMLVESVRDYAIFMLDPAGHVATWNGGAARFKGYTASEIIGRHFSAFYPDVPGRAETCARELEIAARDGRFEDEGWRVRKDGSQFWANVVITAMRDAAGTLIGFSKVTRDLTDRKRAEEERTALLAAEQANQAKDEFLAMLGHELRNPLAPIVTALQLIKLRDPQRRDREHEILERQVNQMIRLVDDLLDVSRIARGTIELRRRRIDLRVALAQAAEIASPSFASRGQQFVAEVSHQPLVVDGDDARLIQVFSNLLNNASKYTQPGGHIRLIAQQVDDHVSIEVQDNGPGIAPELLPRVFELFVQGSQAADRANGGLGLGLAVVRSIVLLHGGHVEAHSGGDRRGSSFMVRLPLDASATGSANHAVPASTTAAPRARYRILLVDDNDDARALLAELLVSSGHDVTTAADGPSALDALARGMPQVAVLDIGLPGMDGYELATRIRARPGGDKIRILALTGYGQAGDQARSDAAGFDHHFVKPVDIERLLQHIADPPR